MTSSIFRGLFGLISVFGEIADERLRIMRTTRKPDRGILTPSRQCVTARGSRRHRAMTQRIGTATWVCVALSAATCVAAGADVTVVERPGRGESNHHYTTNRSPLLPSPLVKMPVGSVRPGGWLRKQLELQAAGFHGHLGEISEFLKKERNS